MNNIRQLSVKHIALPPCDVLSSVHCDLDLSVFIKFVNIVIIKYL